MENESESTGLDLAVPIDEWVILLAQALRDWSPGELDVSLVVAVAEVAAWAADAPVDAWRTENRESLVLDLERAAGAVGENTRAFVAAKVGNMTTQVSQFKHVKGPGREYLSQIEADARTLLASFESRESLLASWRDAVAASRRGQFEVLAGSLAQLGDALERSGQPAHSMFLDFASAIVGYEYGGVMFRTSTAAMALDARLEFVEGLLSRGAEVGACVVWLSYADARLTGDANFGVVAFYEVDQEVAQILEGIPSEFPHRAELERVVESDPERWVPGEHRRYHVLARVELGQRASHGALTAARELVDIFLTQASLESGGTLWRSSGSAVVIVDGVETGGSWDTFRESGSPDHFGQNATAEALRRLGPALGRALEERQMPESLIQASRRMAEARRPESREGTFGNCNQIDARSVIALEDAAFNHIASFGSGDARALDKTIRDRWPHAMWRTQLQSTARQYLGEGTGAQRVAWLALNRAEVNGLVAWLGELRGVHEVIIDACDGELRRDRVRTVLASSTVAVEFTRVLSEFGGQCEGVADRLRRVRNALTHGSPVSQSVLTSVRAYSRYRVETAWSLALEAFLEERSLGELIQDHSELQVELREFLASGIGPADFAAIERLL